MTHDPNDPTEPEDHDIPELFDRLESRVASPDPDAIRAEAGRRGAVRRRTLSLAGAFVLVAAIAGGALALTGDDNTSTVTADDTGVDAADSGGTPNEMPAVAEDSAPRLQGTTLVSDRSLRSQMVGTTWHVGAVRGDSRGFGANSGYVIFNANPDEYGLPQGIETVLYVDGCEGSAYEITWSNIVPRFEKPVFLLRQSHVAFRVVSQLSVIPTAANMNCVETTSRPTLLEGAGITIGQSEGADAITMGVLCPPNAACTPQGLWTIDLMSIRVAEPARPQTVYGEATVVIQDCANSSWISFNGGRWLAGRLPAVWQELERVSVSVLVDGNSLIATDADGNYAPFGLDDGQPRPQPCLLFNLEQPTTTVPPETTTTAAAATTIPLVQPPAWSTAVLAIEAEFDGEPGNEQIWLEHDGSIHVGNRSGIADMWEISDYWFAEQAELFIVPFDGNVNAVVLALPEKGDEDPQNVYQVFVVDNGELRRIFNQTIGDYYQSLLEFGGDGTVSYVEDGFAACRRVGIDAKIVVRQQVWLSVGDTGILDAESRQDSIEEQDCDFLAG